MKNEKLKIKESLRDDNFQKGSSYFLEGTNNVGVLLLHGWSSPTEELLPLGKYLKTLGYTVSIPLLRGHGTKPEDLKDVTWRDWLADARIALAELKKNSSRIFVGGISMGGSIAMLLAGDEQVTGLVTMGASIKFRFHNLAKFSLYLMGLGKTYRKKYYPPWVRKKMGRRNVYMHYPIESAKEVIRLAEYLRKKLGGIDKPILIMQSTTDHLVSRQSPRIIYSGVKSKVKEIFWIKDAYHVFAGEKKVWEKIADFIKKSNFGLL